MLKNTSLTLSARKIFITGTDTDVGKTVFSLALLEALKKGGFTTAVLKPVAAGAEDVDGIFKNTDAEQLSKHASIKYPYSSVNPFLYKMAVAPHIAAEHEDSSIDVTHCVKQCEPVLNSKADWVIIEGAGGWLVPLNNCETMADLAVGLQAEVILVVGVRLGCINHTLLTVAAIEQAGCRLVGWVANHIEPSMPEASNNIKSIEERLKAPLLASIPYLTDINVAEASRYIDIDRLLKH